MIKKLSAFLVFTIFLASANCVDATYVKGYFRKDGTYVQGHFKTKPDGKLYNNYSDNGDIIPYPPKKKSKKSRKTYKIRTNF